MRTLEQLDQEFPGAADHGLKPEQVVQSRQAHGANKLTPLPRQPLWEKFLEKFDEPIIKILLAAALLSMFVELFRGNPDADPPVPGNPLAAGIALAAVAAAALALYFLRKTQWIPT